MKCCFCNRVITNNNSHDAYPIRRETFYGDRVDRCCTRCNKKIVVPNRIMWGRNLELIGADQREILRKKNYSELIEFSKGITDYLAQQDYVMQ